MCGIAGFAGFQQDGLIGEMTKCIFHRGPDDFGFFKDKDINFGLRRLSIIDIKRGHQPMSTTDGDITIIFNGEIYNYKELRKDLKQKGVSFSTHSDTEILLKSYREYGLDCLQKFNGMFGFAIWDKREKKLILARDRLGIKPLYYSIKNHKIIFSSEIKAILKFKDISRELNYNAIDDFLRLRYIPGEQTMFKEIKLLPPATFLVYKSGNVTTNEFWKLNFSNDHLMDKYNENDIVEEFQDLLVKSVKYRMQSDVPLGVYLSGGLDSSVIAHLVSKNSSVQTKLFSHGYDGVTDELKLARVTANNVSGIHEEVMIKEKHFDNLKHIIYHLETPIANSDIIGFDLLARIACPSVKVILAGEGADELFGSYVHQTTIMKSNAYFNKLPLWVRGKVLKPFINKLPLKVLDYFFDYPGYRVDDVVRKKAADLVGSDTLSRQYFSLNSLFHSKQKDLLYTNEFKKELTNNDTEEISILKQLLDNRDDVSLHNKLIRAEMKYWLPNYHLIKEDKIAMSHSLEQRYPFLDHKLVEFVAKLPTKNKYRNGVTKDILRKASSKWLPDEIINRKKGPILVPIDKCFEKKFRAAANEYLSKDQINKSGYYNYSEIKKLLNNLDKNSFMYHRQIFALLALEIWKKAFDKV